MGTNATASLKAILDFCNDRWTESDQRPPSGFPNADMLTGKKMAYNDVIQFVRREMIELGCERAGPP